jgi:hypothetical protein
MAPLIYTSHHAANAITIATQQRQQYATAVRSSQAFYYSFIALAPASTFLAHPIAKTNLEFM